MNKDVNPYSMRVSFEVWWRCPEGPDHAWFKALSAMDMNVLPLCPFCRHKTVSVTNSLATLFPDLAAEWHESKNGALKPSDVTTKSIDRVWWRCAQDATHEWTARISNRAFNETGCPECWRAKRSAGHFKTLNAARKAERVARGELTRSERLTPKILKLIEEGFSYQAIAAKLKIGKTTVGTVFKMHRESMK